MKDVKIIVSDIDGTLLTSHHVISEYTKKVLIDYQERGVSVVLASGRNIDSLIKIGEDIHMSQYPQSGFICLNGLEIRDAKGECLYKDKQLSYEDVKQLDRLACEHFLDAVLFFEDNIYIIEHGKTGIMEYHFLSSQQHKVENLNEIPISYFRTLKKMALLQDERVMKESLSQMQEKVKGLYELNLVESDWVEVSPFGVNKGEALRKLAKMKDVSLNDVVAFGNGENDISMLLMAGTGVAMGNSFESVKQQADEICLDNNHDGLGHYLMEE